MITTCLKIMLVIVCYCIILNYFPYKAIQVKNPTTDTSVYVDIFAKRVEPCNLHKLVAELYRDQKSKQTPGFIYMYRDGDDVHKIGRTVGVSKRLKQWRKQCKKRLNFVGKWHTEKHQICERIIHLELKLNGYWLGKRSCTCKGKYHIEFFNGSARTLLEVIDFWVSYFNKCPIY